MGRMASPGHLGSIKNTADGKRKAISTFLARRGDFLERMAVCGNAALGRAGSLFIGPISHDLKARLIFTRPLLIDIVQNIFDTHPHDQCVCCFPYHIIIKLSFSAREVHPFTIFVLFLLGDLSDFEEIHTLLLHF